MTRAEPPRTQTEPPSKAQLAARLTTLMDIARAAMAGADPGLRDAIAAQSFLLPRTAHPSALAQHGPAFAGRAPARSRLGTLARLLRGAARRESDWVGADLPSRAGILVLSHYVGAGVTDDYFGSLAAAQVDGLPTVTARLNHTWRPLHRIAAACHGDVVFSRHTPLREGLRNLRAVTRAARALGPFVGDAFYAAHIRAEATASSNLFALRTATQVSRLVQRLQPNVLLLTWEGHPWERLAIAAARRASPGITCIAYHHGPLWPLATATAQPLHPDYDPDALAVTGDAAQAFFSARPLWQTRPVRIVGSPRAAGLVAEAPSRGNRLLVLPEGILDETVALFGLALAAKERHPDLEIDLRLHPVLDRRKVLAALPTLGSLPKGVRWSDGPLDAALHGARWALYRGSTAALAGLKAGVRPILWCPPGAIEIDPLNAPGPWRLKVADARDLAAELGRDTGQHDAIRLRAFRAAADHGRTLFREAQPEAMRALIDALAQRR
jgi:hypothetical protein